MALLFEGSYILRRGAGIQCAHVCEVNIGWDVMCGILGYPVVTILCTSVTWQHCGHCVVLYYQDYHGCTIIYREFHLFLQCVECRYFI